MAAGNDPEGDGVAPHGQAAPAPGDIDIDVVVEHRNPMIGRPAPGLRGQRLGAPLSVTSRYDDRSTIVGQRCPIGSARRSALTIARTGTRSAWPRLLTPPLFRERKSEVAPTSSTSQVMVLHSRSDAYPDASASMIDPLAFRRARRGRCVGGHLEPSVVAPVRRVVPPVRLIPASFSCIADATTHLYAPAPDGFALAASRPVTHVQARVDGTVFPCPL